MTRPDPLSLLHNDADIVVINKPAGLAVIPGRAETDTVIERLAAQLGLPCRGSADPRVRVVHRLDKDTSGVLMFAKHVAAQRHLSHQFQNNTIEKEYLALVVGRPAESSGEIDAALAPHPTQKEKMAVSRHGRPAVTRWQIEQTMRRFTLLRVFPKTGKTHQIRVHLAHIGHRLAIDALYGSPDPILLSQHKRRYRPTRDEEERPLIARLTLHAHKLSFDHPNGSGRATIEAPLPKDFRATIAQLIKA
ncbi:MAG TPA: RluA family pseudouridine synthase [Tepidisphaeraceae bacterium]|jgi:23S rRNA pseudouridine955/2504/2580 synthase/23S rRNA pseudouridine1911/1915/1917 synthase